MSRLLATKSSRITTGAIAAALLLALAGNAAAKGDVAAGANKAKACTDCHGSDGNATDVSKSQLDKPRLAGQYADYIARALHEYKTGDRKNPVMATQAAPLSDQDIEDIAAYYASLPSKLHDLSHMKK